MRMKTIEGMKNQRNHFKAKAAAARGNRSPGTVARACRAAVARLGRQFLAELAGEYKSSLPGQWLEGALAEAEAVAWSTPFPLLFLPELAREKAHNARQWAERQQEILQAAPLYGPNQAN